MRPLVNHYREASVQVDAVPVLTAEATTPRKQWSSILRTRRAMNRVESQHDDTAPTPRFCNRLFKTPRWVQSQRVEALQLQQQQTENTNWIVGVFNPLMQFYESLPWLLLVAWAFNVSVTTMLILLPLTLLAFHCDRHTLWASVANVGATPASALRFIVMLIAVPVTVLCYRYGHVLPIFVIDAGSLRSFQRTYDEVFYPYYLYLVNTLQGLCKYYHYIANAQQGRYIFLVAIIVNVWCETVRFQNRCRRRFRLRRRRTTTKRWRFR